MAYINKNEAPEWLKTDYQFQIWIGALFMFVGGLLAIVLIGYFILLFLAIWLIVRCIKAMKALDANEAHPNSTGWMF